MATKADLTIDQGTTFSTDLTLTDQYGNKVPLAGFSASSQIRKWYTSVNPSATFTTNINANTATITLQLTSDDTSALDSGRYVYDVEITDGMTVSRIVEGIVTVTPSVTR
jgi:hypothetical protein